jgi:AcrR family transcriptional regulator
MLYHVVNNVQEIFERRSRKMVKQMKTMTSAASGPTAERHELLREALLAAVERTVAAEGYQALRARSLAQQVGCAVGAIYNVFPDLDALIFAAKARTLDGLDRALAQAVAAVGGDGKSAAHEIATGKLLALADAYLRFAIDRSAHWRMLFEYRAAPGTEVPAWYPDRLSALFAHLDAPLRAIVPDLADDKRALLGRALFSAVHGIIALGLEEKIDTPSSASIAGQVATIVRACIAGLRTGASGDRIVRL